MNKMTFKMKCNLTENIILFVDQSLEAATPKNQQHENLKHIENMATSKDRKRLSAT